MDKLENSSFFLVLYVAMGFLSATEEYLLLIENLITHDPSHLLSWYIA